MLMILLAFLFITFEVVIVHSYLYTFLNLIGCILLGTDSLSKHTWSAVGTNILFITISLWLLGITIKKERLSKGKRTKGKK